jgi:2'-5' RNA ligase
MAKFKRLFFAMEVVAPWPDKYPAGRLICESDRHLTLAFLGDADLSFIERHLPSMPQPSFSMGPTGVFTKPLFLPVHEPHVVAWHVGWWEKERAILQYRQTLVEWIRKLGFSIQDSFLPHVTMARKPEKPEEWERSFSPLPFFAKDILLCSSLGHSTYETCWKMAIAAPFTPIEHMADIAYIVRGESLEALYVHAWAALCFFEPLLTVYFVPESPATLLQLIACLNARIAMADSERGCSIKAVSHHGTLRQLDNHIEWEMIADV